MARTPLSERVLPNYTRGEEIANMVTHIIGAAMGIVVLVLAIVLAAVHSNGWGVVGGTVYGVSMIALFTISSVYHGLLPCMGKKVLQVIDHCTIYLLIAGTYTPILLAAMRPDYPRLSWIIFGCEWGIAAFAAVFTAIDHKKYAALAMISYIGMGWFIVLALEPTIASVGMKGFLLLLWGGISYTVGAVLYGIGSKKPVFHTVFHVFVDIGCLLQAICILRYVL